MLKSIPNYFVNICTTSTYLHSMTWCVKPQFEDKRVVMNEHNRLFHNQYAVYKSS